MVDPVPMMHHEGRAADAATGLAARLKIRTERLHREAERSGIIQDLLRGRAELPAYALLLRNLLLVYEALEAGLDGLRQDSPAAVLATPEIYRAAALRSDLDHLVGPDWVASLPPLPVAADYVRRIVRAAQESDGQRLLAHAYVRYLGDLNGGQILKRLLAKHLGLGADQLTFYDFPDIADAPAFAHRYRAAIDAAILPAEATESVIEEACIAFRLNIALSNDVASHNPTSASPEKAALA